MNLLVTTIADSLGWEDQQKIARWRDRKHIVEFMPFEQITSYLRVGYASSLALVDAIVCVADQAPAGFIMQYGALPLSFALYLADEVRALPENCAMRDGRKWRSIPLIIFRTIFEHELADRVRNDTHARILFTPGNHPLVAINQIQEVVDEYRDRVLEDYRRLGIAVRFVRGHAQVGPALRMKDPHIESEYYHSISDRRDHSGWVTVKRDSDALRYDVEVFYRLIDSHASETEMHRFFEEHPAFLMEARLGIPISHKPNFAEPKNNRPDFAISPILGPHADQSVELLELKGPGDGVVRSGFHAGLTSKVYRAIEQVRDYEEYLRNPRNRDSVLRAFGFLPERSNLAVLIGRDPKSVEHLEALQRRRGQVDVKVITYDEILQTQASQITPRLIYDVRSFG